MQFDTDGCVEFEISELNLYRKKNVDIHFIRSLDIADEGKEIVIPTLEGNINMIASAEQYIMIGPCNDIYPIPQKLFDKRYDVIEETALVEKCELISGWNSNNIKCCRLKKETLVYAKEVSVEFKVYVKHCDSVIYGNPGDFYAVSYEDTDNAYIIGKFVMDNTYELVK